MEAVLAYAGMLCGFIFPVCLISAIREKDGKPGSAIGACVTFGIIVVSIILY